MKTNVYIDGFNLYYGCLKGTPHREDLRLNNWVPFNPDRPPARTPLGTTEG